MIPLTITDDVFDTHTFPLGTDHWVMELSDFLQGNKCAYVFTNSNHTKTVHSNSYFLFTYMSSAHEGAGEE